MFSPVPGRRHHLPWWWSSSRSEFQNTLPSPSATHDDSLVNSSFWTHLDAPQNPLYTFFTQSSGAIKSGSIHRFGPTFVTWVVAEVTFSAMRMGEPADSLPRLLTCTWVRRGRERERKKKQESGENCCKFTNTCKFYEQKAISVSRSEPWRAAGLFRTHRGNTLSAGVGDVTQSGETRILKHTHSVPPSDFPFVTLSYFLPGIKNRSPFGFVKTR